MSSGVFSSYIAGFSYVGLKSSGEKQFQGNEQTIWARKTVSNGAKISCMKTWNPVNNKKYETLSYLPPMTDESIAREIEYMISKGWIPCLEFDELGHVHRSNSSIPGYYDGRYWTLWKLPMFGCSDSSQVLQEIDECKKAYPNAFIRCFAFDSKRNTQSMSFLVQKPSST